MNISWVDVRAFTSAFVISLVTNILAIIFLDYGSYFSSSFYFISYRNGLFILLSLSVGILFSLIARHVRNQQLINTPLFGSSPRDLDQTIKSINKENYGVLWRINLGYYISDTKIHAVAEGPFCPTCQLRLSPKIDLSFVGWKDKYYWYCEDCSKKYSRPNDALMNEDSVMEKIGIRELT